MTDAAENTAGKKGLLAGIGLALAGLAHFVKPDLFKGAITRDGVPGRHRQAPQGQRIDRDGARRRPDRAADPQARDRRRDRLRPVPGRQRRPQPLAGDLWLY